MQQNGVRFLSLDGIPTETPDRDGAVFFMRDPLGSWLPSKGNYLYEIDTACVKIHDALASRVFGSADSFYAFLRAAPEFLMTAGMNSEAPVSKDQFVKLLEIVPSEIPAHQGLYLFDCRRLVSAIQECSKEVMQLQGEFYQVLNLEELFYPAIHEGDGVRYVTSPVVTKLFALLGFVFIRLHSLLDYVTKLAFEIENLRSQFGSYPKLASRHLLYGDKKKIRANNAKGSLFESCPQLTEIESVRNLLIHDGLLDDMPKAYKVIVAGECIEKFVLFPDRGKEGRLESFKNRTLFYGSEDKINLRLPELLSEFQSRLMTTLELLCRSLLESEDKPTRTEG